MNYTEKIINHANKLNELYNIASEAVRKGVLSSFTVNNMDHSDMIGKGLYLGLNMTYHAIELEINNIKSMMENGDKEIKELTVEMIKELLDEGIEVELECIDRDGFLDDHSANKEILSVGKLIVERVIDNDIKIEKAVSRIIPREIAYFRIKEQESVIEKEPSATFDDLIGAAVKAVSDGLMVITYIGGNILKFEIVMPYPEFDKCYQVLSNQEEYIKEHIEIIKSLYTETFTIESEEDVNRVNKTAKIKLSNGIDLWVKESNGGSFINVCEIGSVISNSLNFISLKGATITQKKGGK